MIELIQWFKEVGHDWHHWIAIVGWSVGIVAGYKITKTCNAIMEYLSKL